jgi:hypothetical protein
MIRNTLLALLALASPALAAAQRPTLSQNVRNFVAVDTATFAITNVLLLDGTGAAPRPAQTVIVRDGKIAEVGPSNRVRIPAGALTIDGTGQTLIPGIVGMHDHLYYTASGGRSVALSFSGPRLYLASGVTSIRTTGTQSPYVDINMRRNVEAGNIPGPRIHITTPYLTGEGGGGTMSVATDTAQARRFIAYWAGEGATWVKFYTNISRAAMGAAIDEAHKRGMRATGHICSVTYREAVALDIDDLAHGAHTASDFVAGKELDRCPTNLMAVLDTAVDPAGPIAKSVIDAMVRGKVSMTTTIPIYELFYQGRGAPSARTLELMAPEVRDAYLAERKAIDTASTWALTPAGLRRAMAFDKAFFDAGGVLASGVDPTGNGGALPGLGDQRGYELLIEAGFTPPQAVQVMTLNGAKILGVDATLGSVQTGRIADLVLLRGDLTKDPAVIHSPITVFKDGIGYDSEKIYAAVRGRVGIN